VKEEKRNQTEEKFGEPHKYIAAQYSFAEQILPKSIDEQAPDTKRVEAIEQVLWRFEHDNPCHEQVDYCVGYRDIIVEHDDITSCADNVIV
jgi:hypothetical protein